jgi:hypothetical protein
MRRDELERWVLKLYAEACEVDAEAATDVVRALTGCHKVFCPQPHSRGRLHRVAAALLREPGSRRDGP